MLEVLADRGPIPSIVPLTIFGRLAVSR